jgi:hypothetical protein
MIECPSADVESFMTTNKLMPLDEELKPVMLIYQVIFAPTREADRHFKRKRSQATILSKKTRRRSMTVYA